MTDDFFCEMIEASRHIRRFVRIQLHKMRLRFFFHFVHVRFARHFVRIENGLLEGFFRIGANFRFQFRRNFRKYHLALRFPDLCDDLLLESDEFFDFLVCKHNRVEHFFLRCFERAAFDHQNRRLRARDRDIHRRFFQLLLRRHQDKRTVHAPHAHTGNRPVPRNIGNSERHRCPQHPAKLRRIVVIDGEHRRHHVYIVAAAFIKKRTNRTINQARAQNRRVARTPFTPQKTARHFADGIHFFFIIDGEREKIRPLARRLAGGRRDEHRRIPEANQSGPTGLLRHFPGLNRQFPTGPIHGKFFEHLVPPILTHYI